MCFNVGTCKDHSVSVIIGWELYLRVGKTVKLGSADSSLALLLSKTLSLARHRTPARTRCRNPTEAKWKPVAVSWPVFFLFSSLAAAQSASASPRNASRPLIGQRPQPVCLHCRHPALAHAHSHCGSVFTLCSHLLGRAVCCCRCIIIPKWLRLSIRWPLNACLSDSTWYSHSNWY